MTIMHQGGSVAVAIVPRASLMILFIYTVLALDKKQRIAGKGTLSFLSRQGSVSRIFWQGYPFFLLGFLIFTSVRLSANTPPSQEKHIWATPKSAKRPLNKLLSSRCLRLRVCLLVWEWLKCSFADFGAFEGTPPNKS